MVHFVVVLFKSGLVSKVWEINPLSAASLSLVEGTVVAVPEPPSPSLDTGFEATSCAMFLAKRSRSPLSTFSLLFMAPGRDFILFRLMMLTWSCGLSPAGCLTPPSVSTSSALGRASANESSVATSFLLGRLRLGFFAEDLVTLSISRACLILRLSFLDDGKSESVSSAVSVLDDFLRIDFRGCAERAGSPRRGACQEAVSRRLKHEELAKQVYLPWPVQSVWRLNNLRSGMCNAGKADTVVDYKKFMGAS